MMDKSSYEQAQKVFNVQVNKSSKSMVYDNTVSNGKELSDYFMW